MAVDYDSTTYMHFLCRKALLHSRRTRVFVENKLFKCKNESLNRAKSWLTNFIVDTGPFSESVDGDLVTGLERSQPGVARHKYGIGLCARIDYRSNWRSEV